MPKEEESCFWMTEVLIVQVSSEGSRVRVRLWTRCVLCVSQINHALPTRAGCISVFLVISQRNPGQHFNLPSGDETPPRTAQKVDFCQDDSIKNGSATQTRTQRWFSWRSSFLLRILKKEAHGSRERASWISVSLHDHREEDKWRKEGGEKERLELIWAQQG